jgi:hypothetical protein
VNGDPDLEVDYVAQAIDTAHGVDVRRVGLIP